MDGAGRLQLVSVLPGGAPASGLIEIGDTNTPGERCLGGRVTDRVDDR